MFGDFNASLTELDDEQRVKMANLLSDRAEYQEMTAELNRRKSALALNPTEEAERELNEYSSAVVAPTRLKLAEQMQELFKETIDVDALKTMLPMLLAGILSSVNVPLLLNVIGLDPDMIGQLVETGRDFLQGDD